MAQEIYHRSEWGNPNEQWGNVYLNADLTNELYKRASEYENSWVTDQLLNGVGTKPSIIMTPTAYEDGVLNSVKPAKTFGSELVTNGDFSDGANDWFTLGSGASLPGGDVTNGVLSIGSAEGFTQNVVQLIGDFNQNEKIKVIVKAKIGQSGSNLTLRLSTNIYGANTISIVSSVPITSDYQTFEYEYENTTVNNYKYFSFREGNGSGSVLIDSITIKKITEADFDFTRGSSATRVNEKGLIQDVQILSDELVQNGNFEQIGSELVTNGDFANWTNDNPDSWTITGTENENNYITEYQGKARYVSDGSTLFISQNILTTGKFYKITADIVVNSGGGMRFQLGANGVHHVFTTTQSIVLYAQQSGTDGNFQIIRQGATDVVIDNVSVKEVGQNWDLTDGATITDNGVRILSDGTYQRAIQYNVLTVGKQYKVQYEIVENNSGELKMSSSFGLTPIPSTVGIHTVYGEALQTFLTIERSGACDVTIDNISVIEITDDTDLPRINYTNFDYENGEVVPYTGEGSLLLEPQSTNLVTYSEAFSNWSRSSGVIVTDNTTDLLSPSGEYNASKIEYGNSSKNLFQAPTLSGIYSGSFFVKGTIGETIRMSVGGNEQNFTLSGGWDRIKIENVTALANTINVNTYGGATARTIYLWGAQIEEGSYATSYIPTQGSAVTRLADVCNNAGSSDLINSTEGVLYAEIAALADDGTNRLFSLSNDTTSNRIFLGFNSVSNSIRFRVQVNNVYQAENNFIVADTTQYSKIAFKYKENDFALWVNGVEVAVDNSGSTFPLNTINKLNLDSSIGGSPLYGNVKSVAVFKEALSDTELQKLTQV